MPFSYSEWPWPIYFTWLISILLFILFWMTYLSNIICLAFSKFEWLSHLPDSIIWQSAIVNDLDLFILFWMTLTYVLHFISCYSPILNDWTWLFYVLLFWMILTYLSDMIVWHSPILNDIDLLLRRSPILNDLDLLTRLYHLAFSYSEWHWPIWHFPIVNGLHLFTAHNNLTLFYSEWPWPNWKC